MKGFPPRESERRVRELEVGTRIRKLREMPIFMGGMYFLSWKK